MQTQISNLAPVYEHDFFSDQVIDNPYPHYRVLRDLGPAVWMERHEVWAISRFEGVRSALRNAKVFSSGGGVMFNEPLNLGTGGRSTLCMDDPEHLPLRRTLAQPMLPASLATIRSDVAALADRQVERFVGQESFDAVACLSQFLPLMVVTDLVGLTEDGKGRMLEWASAMFDSMGPLGNERTMLGLQKTPEILQYIQQVDPAQLKPDSWAAKLFQCADQGHISEERARLLLVDYIGPSLDTTINATSSAIWLFGQFPDQWDAVRSDPTLIGNSINEVIRLESPIRAFSRRVTEDVEVGGTLLKEGSRAMIIYASANRDERKWNDPERFDVTRKVADHMGFGMGTHACAGMHLARLEMQCLLEALAKRVRRIELGEAVRTTHNILRGLTSLQVTLH